MKRVHVSLLTLIVVCLAGAATAVQLQEGTAVQEGLILQTAVADQCQLAGDDDLATLPTSTILDDVRTSIICSGQFCTSSSQCDDVPGWHKTCRFNNCCYF